MSKHLRPWLASDLTVEFEAALKWKKKSIITSRKVKIKHEPSNPPNKNSDDDDDDMKDEDGDDDDQEKFSDDGSNLKVDLTRPTGIKSHVQIIKFLDDKLPYRCQLSDGQFYIIGRLTKDLAERLQNDTGKPLSEMVNGLLSIKSYTFVVTGFGPIESRMVLAIDAARFKNLPSDLPDNQYPVLLSSDVSFKSFWKLLIKYDQGKLDNEELEGVKRQYSQSQSVSPAIPQLKSPKIGHDSVQVSQMGFESQIPLNSDRRQLIRPQEIPEISIAQGTNLAGPVGRSNLIKKTTEARDLLVSLLAGSKSRETRQGLTSVAPFAGPSMMAPDRNLVATEPITEDTVGTQISSEASKPSPAVSSVDTRVETKAKSAEMSDIGIASEAEPMEEVEQIQQPSEPLESLPGEHVQVPVEPVSMTADQVIVKIAIGSLQKMPAKDEKDQLRMPDLRYQKYSRLAIPKDQQSLLQKKFSWRPAPPGCTFPPVNVPLTVLESLITPKVIESNRHTLVVENDRTQVEVGNVSNDEGNAERGKGGKGEEGGEGEQEREDEEKEEEGQSKTRDDVEMAQDDDDDEAGSIVSWPLSSAHSPDKPDRYQETLPPDSSAESPSRLSPSAVSHSRRGKSNDKSVDRVEAGTPQFDESVDNHEPIHENGPKSNQQITSSRVEETPRKEGQQNNAPENSEQNLELEAANINSKDEEQVVDPVSIASAYQNPIQDQANHQSHKAVSTTDTSPRPAKRQCRVPLFSQSEHVSQDPAIAHAARRREMLGALRANSVNVQERDNHNDYHSTNLEEPMINSSTTSITRETMRLLAQLSDSPSMTYDSPVMYQDFNHADFDMIDVDDTNSLPLMNTQEVMSFLDPTDPFIDEHSSLPQHSKSPVRNHLQSLPEIMLSTQMTFMQSSTEKDDQAIDEETTFVYDTLYNVDRTPANEDIHSSTQSPRRLINQDDDLDVSMESPVVRASPVVLSEKDLFAPDKDMLADTEVANKSFMDSASVEKDSDIATVYHLNQTVVEEKEVELPMVEVSKIDTLALPESVPVNSILVTETTSPLIINNGPLLANQETCPVNSTSNIETDDTDTDSSDDEIDEIISTSDGNVKKVGNRITRMQLFTKQYTGLRCFQTAAEKAAEDCEPVDYTIRDSLQQGNDVEKVITKKVKRINILGWKLL